MQRHRKAVARQPPGLPDPIYAAKGSFPTGYAHPDDAVRAFWLDVQHLG